MTLVNSTFDATVKTVINCSNGSLGSIVVQTTMNRSFDYYFDHDHKNIWMVFFFDPFKHEVGEIKNHPNQQNMFFSRLHSIKYNTYSNKTYFFLIKKFSNSFHQSSWRKSWIGRSTIESIGSMIHCIGRRWKCWRYVRYKFTLKNSQIEDWMALSFDRWWLNYLERFGKERVFIIKMSIWVELIENLFEMETPDPNHE